MFAPFPRLLGPPQTRRVVRLALGALVLFWGCASRGELAPPPPDNLQLVDGAVAEALTGLLAEVELRSPHPLRICVAEARHARYLQDHLVGAFCDQDQRVLVCDEGSEAAWKLDVELLELRLRYLSLGGLWRGGKMRRTADVAFSVTLADEFGGVRLQERYAAAVEDQVPESSLSQLEHGPFQPERSGDPLPGLLEPAIAAGVALGMTYLLIGTHHEG